ncbi:hypothetical protein [Priestia flexa]|uniref:hypothetical protein n=1 Tax=Priestia flexa TaxID=86664 RepID=UPI000473EBD6|nr:hypothetical protein [Priestia flexa]
MRRITKYLFPLLLLVFILGCSNENVGIDNTEVKVEAEQTTKNPLNIKYQDDVKLTWKDVQYDMENNLQELFYISGEAKLSSYYNYAFTDKKKYFSVEIKPYDGDTSNSWYIYIDREKESKLYNKMMNEGTIPLEIIAGIPEKAYQKSQGNMALGTIVQY